MKKKVFLFMLTAVMLSVVCGLTGCGEKGAEAETGTKTEAEAQTSSEEEAGSEEENAGIHTVTFYDSDKTTVLNSVKVEDGAVVEEYEPEKEGFTFTGWFATPQLSHKFDFATAITEDTSLFAGFVSYVEDTRSFAIVGSGKSQALMESNWGEVIGEAQTMTKEDVEGANIYTITLDLAEGDEFQFAIDSAWSAQRGYGYLTTIEQDGVECFKNSGGLGDTGVKKANIKVERSGNYTLTLTTYPGEDTYDTEDPYYTEEGKENFNYNAFDTISWVYNGESADKGAEYQTDYYIKGAVITGWEDVYTEETKFTEKDGIYTLGIALEEGDEFLFTTLLTSGDSQSVGNEYVRYTNIEESDSDSLACVTGTENANMVAVKAGVYTFTYDPATQILQVACE